MKNIVLFGAPGSGKGTQSELLIEKYGFKHISTGDALRAEIKQGTELGKIAQGFINDGKLLPDDLIIKLLASVYDSMLPCEGIIFDGFPRTIPQAEALNEMLKERGETLSAMIELDVPEEELITRLILRGKSSGRADDNEATIRQRLEVYKQQTRPVSDWYEKEGSRHAIKGIGSLESILADICKVVDAL